MNVVKQINYWRTGSDEDWDAAVIMIEAGKMRHGLFFLHLAMEKIMKAHVTRTTEETPPRIHNLIQLMKRADLPLNQEQSKLLKILNSYCMEGRYANEVASPPSKERAMEILQQSLEVRTWLIGLL